VLRFAIRKFNDQFAFPYRYGKLTERLAPLLHDVDSVLDVGTGDGRLGRHLMDATGCHITGLDVCLQPHPHIKVHHYNGRKFPFADDTFDSVLMVDMLHHANNIEQMLSEAHRVARRFVIVKDHYWNTRLDVATLHVADYLGNIPYGVPLPYNYLRLNEWQDMFKRHGLEELECATFKYNRLEPAHHIMVKLRAQDVKPKRSATSHQQPAAGAERHVQGPFVPVPTGVQEQSAV
jgi:SAM-dependent methyltransferase